MRMLIAIGAAALVISTGIVAGTAAAAATGTGVLTGQTQISFGCPGPVRVGGPFCHPWHAFAHARFSVARSRAGGAVDPRLVVSDVRGRFTLRLTTGSYTLTPLPQAHTDGGAALQVRIAAGQVTRVLVRFQGFPEML
jgi:hypothetical protein